MLKESDITTILESFRALAHLEQAYGIEACAKQRRELEEIASRKIDLDDCGRTLLLQVSDNGKGITRFSCFPEDGRYTRITYVTEQPLHIDYSWIADSRIARRLILDLYAMTHAAIVGVNEPGGVKKRFLDFCLHAQFQIEPLLRYYFMETGEWTNLKWRDQNGQLRDPSHAYLQRKFGERHYPYITGKGSVVADLMNRNYYTLEALRVTRNHCLHRFRMPASEQERQKALQSRTVWINMTYNRKYYTNDAEQGVIVDHFDNLDFNRVMLTLSDVVSKMRSDLKM